MSQGSLEQAPAGTGLATLSLPGGPALDSPVWLAPMAGYTDLPFRLCVRRLGGLGLAFTPLLSPDSLVRGDSRRRRDLLATTSEDRPLAHQIYGKDADVMARAAVWLQERGATVIDLNMGCPQKKISARGAGAGLLRSPEKAVALAAEVVRAVRVPVTAKIRLGWDAQSPVAAELAQELERVGIVAVTVHARTRAQGHAGRADWSGIRQVVDAVRAIPVIGNGDIDSAGAARRMVEQTGCRAVMIGRAVLANPWLIRDVWSGLRGHAPPSAPTPAVWRQFARGHFEEMQRLYGEAATVLFRKWLVHYARGLGFNRAQTQPLYAITEPRRLAEAIGW